MRAVDMPWYLYDRTPDLDPCPRCSETAVVTVDGSDPWSMICGEYPAECTACGLEFLAVAWIGDVRSEAGSAGLYAVGILALVVVPAVWIAGHAVALFGRLGGVA